MNVNARSVYKIYLPAIAAVFTVFTMTAHATALSRADEADLLKADQMALQRQILRLDADEARLKADAASGRMSAESKDAYAVYQLQQDIKGEKKDIAADKGASPQMKSDRAALQRQIKRLQLAEARLQSDTKAGKMAATSDDSRQVSQDQQYIKETKKDIASDKASLKSDLQK